jgi:hypothetical protein
VPAQRLNYDVIHKGQSQVYGAASKDVALQTPLPDGVAIEDRTVLFITYQPDGEVLCVRSVPVEEVRGAELKQRTVKGAVEE